MGKKKIVIDVGADEVRGAVFSSFLGRTKIERMESVSITGDETDAKAVEKLLAAFPTDAAITLILPGNLFMVRSVSLPFADRKKIRKALPYKVDGLLPFPVEELLIDSILSTPSNSGSTVMAIATPAKLLEHYLSFFPAGRKPSNVFPDFISLLSLGINIKGDDGIYGAAEIDGGRASMVFIQNGRPVLARSIASINSFSSAAEEISATIAPLTKEGHKIGRLYVAGLEAMHDFPRIEGIAQISPFPAVIKEMSFKEKPSWASVVGGSIVSIEYPWFNMLGLSSETERFERGIKTLSIAAAILLVLGTGDIYMRFRTESKMLSSLKAESRKIFTSVMPNVKKVVREDAQLKDALNKEKETLEALAGKPAPSYLSAMKSMEKIILEHPEIKVREASFEGYSAVISGDGMGIEADGIKKIFSGIEGAGPVQVEEMVQGADPNSYRFRVRIDLAKRGK